LVTFLLAALKQSHKNSRQAVICESLLFTEMTVHSCTQSTYGTIQSHTNDSVQGLM